jgi:hypothetical protein
MSAIQCLPAVFLGVNWQGRDVDRSGPSSSEAKNKRVYNSASPICVYDMYGGKFFLKSAQIIYLKEFICVSLSFISVCMLQLQKER